MPHFAQHNIWFLQLFACAVQWSAFPPLLESHSFSNRKNVATPLPFAAVKYVAEAAAGTIYT